MDHSNSHHEHSNHQRIDTTTAADNQPVQPHQYAINHHQPQHHYYQHYQQQQHQNNYYGMQQQQPNQQPASWQWMPVAIPPPPPPPPNSFLPSQIAVPSLDTKLPLIPQKPQTKRARKRRWGPVLNEQQTTPNEQKNETEHHPENVYYSTNNNGTKDSEMSKETNSTDCAIDAINALSTLQSRWNGPSQKKKRKRGRRRRKKTNNKADSSNNQESEILDDVWIDVDDVVKIMNPHQSSDEQSGGCSKDMDGPEVTGNPKQQYENVDEKSEMSTAELQSYANVLKRALDGASKNQPSIDDGGDDNSEMDISDDDDDDDDEDSFVDTLNFSSSDTFREERTGEADRDKREKEKRALKLAELKAKAKLANAKLRMAMQRKALGTNGRTTPPVLSETIRPNHSSKLPGLQDISALRNIPTLVIPNVHLTGTDDMVRFVHSVYDLSSEDGCSSESDDDNSLSPSPPEAEVTLPNDSQKKSHQSLKQQLQLAKLRLEIKRKEQLLLEKKKKPPGIASDTTNDACLESSEGKCAVIDNGSNLTTSAEDKKVQLEQLRRRQKELKQKNEVSNIKNLINRQRKLLRAKGQEISASSKQLENIERDISSKQNLLDGSNKRLEEMQHRKRIMERMIIKATEKVMTARKALNQHKLQDDS